MNNKLTYAGFCREKHGITLLARVVLDGGLFDFISDSEDCTGWQMGQMQTLTD